MLCGTQGTVYETVCFPLSYPAGNESLIIVNNQNTMAEIIRLASDHGSGNSDRRAPQPTLT